MDSERLILKKRDGKLPELAVDARKVEKAPNLKHLGRSAKLPVRCNDCIYRPQEEGGKIGGCTVYEKDSMCKIRADTRKVMDKYGKSNADQILPLLSEEFESNYELLKFSETIEQMSGQLNPEVTKRINALSGLGKLISDMKTKKHTMTVTETRTLSDDKKMEIARMLSVTQESKDDTKETTAN